MRRTMTLLLGVMVMMAAPAHAQMTTADAKAAELLKQVRAALGGEAALGKVTGLTATGTYQRAMGDRTLDGQLTLDLQLPDKFLRTESLSPMGDVTIINEQGVNGEKLLRNTRTLNAGPGMMIRTPPPPTGDAEAQAVRTARADMTRLTVALLAASPAGMPLTVSHGGEAAADEGKADVLDVKGAGSFAMRLFVDQKTHRPLMVTYQGVAPRIQIQTVRGDGPPPAGGPAGAPGAGGPGAAPAPQLVEIAMYLDDYKQADGVWLPHHVSRSFDGKPSEEWTFTAIKTNPAFKPDTFSAK